MLGSTQTSDIQLTLSLTEAQRLRAVLPGLLQALAERPTTPERHRARRQEAREALAQLSTLLATSLEHSDLPTP
jgi:hypothetical protein